MGVCVGAGGGDPDGKGKGRGLIWENSVILHTLSGFVDVKFKGCFPLELSRLMANGYYLGLA